MNNIKIDESWKQESGKYKCPYCDKEYTKKGICTHIWRKHTEEGLNFTKLHDPNKGFKDGTRKAWNKGLTKETDTRLEEKSIKLREKFNSGELEGYWKNKKHSNSTIIKMKNNKNCGGYRKGSGRGKSGWYKNYYCDSSWELAFVIYNLENNIKFERNTKKFSYIFNRKKHDYMPDFIINNEYIEIKGYITEQWKAKKEQFPHKLKTLYQKDIQKYLDYVINKYGKDFIKLYGSLA